jgi:hypothetical protein
VPTAIGKVAEERSRNGGLRRQYRQGASGALVHRETFSLIIGNKRLAGSLIGGLAETQEMLDYCDRHKIVAEVETIPVQWINEAYERTIRGRRPLPLRHRRHEPEGLKIYVS